MNRIDIPAAAVRVNYRTVNVEGVEVFYREAGPKDAPQVDPRLDQRSVGW